MKCHYEILDVPSDADSSEIKSSYRKLALKWHPDKNLDNTEFAKEQFQLVQQAYEVLSDPHERAWYDKHREQILRGANSEFQDNSLDLFQYFTTTCFKGYGDDETGFYTVYRNVFEQIIKEEMEFVDDKEEFCDVPRFGNSTSDYDDVVGPFYSYWTNYTTKKSYVWLDPNDISERCSRRILKLLEKDNKKVRQQARKERNEEVRNLVAFVKKRDKRVQEQAKLREARILENRQKQEILNKQKRLERKKMLNEESEAQPEWAKFENVKSQLEEIEKHLAEQFGEEFSNSEDEEEDDEVLDLYCVACNKMFKTAKALENHELSKKHRENVERLKEIMLEEEDEEEKEENDLESAQDDLDGVSGTDDDSGDSEQTVKKSKKKKRKAKNVLSVNIEEETNGHVDVKKTEDLDDNFDFTSTRKQKRKNVKTKPKNPEPKIVEESVVSEKPAKKQKKQSRKEITNVEEIDLSHCCVTCKSNFGSKNKLFQHLKQTGHGVYLPNKNNKSKKNSKTKNLENED